MTKIERQDIILSIEDSIIFIAVFVDKLQNQELCMPGACISAYSALTTHGWAGVGWGGGGCGVLGLKFAGYVCVCMHVCMYVCATAFSEPLPHYRF